MLYQCLGVTVDTEKHHVYVFGTKKHLSAGEFRMLTRLIRCRGRFLSREALRSDSNNQEKSLRNVDIMIKRIRRKLFADRRAAHLFIESCYSVGYRIPTRDQLSEKYPP